MLTVHAIIKIFITVKIIVAAQNTVIFSVPNASVIIPGSKTSDRNEVGKKQKLCHKSKYHCTHQFAGGSVAAISTHSGQSYRKLKALKRIA